MLEVALEVGAHRELAASEDVGVVVVVLPDVEHRRTPWLVACVHEVARVVRDVAARV